MVSLCSTFFRFIIIRSYVSFSCSYQYEFGSLLHLLAVEMDMEFLYFYNSLHMYIFIHVLSFLGHFQRRRKKVNCLGRIEKGKKGFWFFAVRTVRLACLGFGFDPDTDR